MKMKIENSSMRTLDIPAIGDDPALLFNAANHPFDVVIHNVGGNLVFLAMDVNNLVNAQSVMDVFQLQTGRDVRLRLAPGQTLYGAGQGGGGLVSLAMHHAIVEVIS